LTRFRCAYGACIDNDLKCNGQTNCVDGSDEDIILCSGIGLGVQIKPIISIKPPPEKSDVLDKLAVGPLNLLPELGIPNFLGRPVTESVSNTIKPPVYSPRPPVTSAWVTSYLKPTEAPTEAPIQTLDTNYKPCSAPPQPENGHYMLHGPQCRSTLFCNVPEKTELQLGSHLVYSCNSGYILNGSSDVSCNFEGKWLNIPVCLGMYINNIYVCK